MNNQEQTLPASSKTATCMKRKFLIGFSCACALGLICAIFHFVAEERPIVIPVDKYIENLDEARIEAKKARNEWESQREARENAEKAQLGELSVPELSKKALTILARAEHPEFILAQAKDAMSIVQPPWTKSTKPEDNKFWTIIYRETIDANHDWWIEQNTVFGQYRLVGNPNQTINFSIREVKLKEILKKIILFGNKKTFYQIAAYGTGVPQNGCEMLSLAEAEKIFPETVDLSEGVYAQHPGNPYALVPLADFHESLATDKATECVVLLGRMGAKSVHVSRMDGKTSSAGGGLGVSSMGHGANVNAELAKGMNAKMDLTVVFSGNSHIDIPPTLLENSVWHKNDAQMKAILSAILSGNRPKEWSFSDEMQSAYSFDFSAAASILGVSEANLRAKFESSKQTQRTFHVDF